LDQWRSRVQLIADALSLAPRAIFVPSTNELGDAPLLAELASHRIDCICSNEAPTPGVHLRSSEVVALANSSIQFLAFTLAPGKGGASPSTSVADLHQQPTGDIRRVVVVDAQAVSIDSTNAFLAQLPAQQLTILNPPPQFRVDADKFPSVVTITPATRGRTVDSIIVHVHANNGAFMGATGLLALATASEDLALSAARAPADSQARDRAASAASLLRAQVTKLTAGSNMVVRIIDSIPPSLPRSESVILLLDKYFSDLEVRASRATEGRHAIGYVGATVCASCHQRNVTEWSKDTFHSSAFTRLEKTKRQFDLQCFECHATGFVEGWPRRATTLEELVVQKDVGCESCHGPGSDHASDSRIQMSRGDTTCSRCHDGDHSPTFFSEKTEFMRRIGCTRLNAK
jgi:hypothetical protein